MYRMISTVFVAAGLCLSAAPALADGYAAMENVPVTGGELRLTDAGMEMLVTDERQSAEAIGFPLKHTDVSVDIAGPMAQVTVEQVFENPFSDPIEAVYLFPLGDEAAVHDYEFVIGDRTIRGVIHEREEARKIYEKAKEEGHTAALLQQEKPNIFQQSLANLPPGEPIRVRFRYVELLDYDDGTYQFVFPMVVGPRYLPQHTTETRPVGAHVAGTKKSTSVSVPYLAPGMRSGHDISLDVRVDPGMPLVSVRSPSHQVDGPLEAGETGVELSIAPGDQIPNKDFILEFSTAGEQTMIGTLSHRAAGEDGFFTLVVQPKAEYRTGDIAEREVVILVDVSGSMSGQPIEVAKATTRALLQTLGPNDSFNIVTFASGVQTFRAQPVPASETNVAEGLRFVDSLQAGGGTEMLAGVARSLKRPPGADDVRMVYVVTDGFIGNDGEILSNVQKKGGVNRIFPVGVGSSPNRYLLDRLAEIGRGFPTYVGLGDSPEPAIGALVEKTVHPYLTDVEIDWGSLHVYDVTPEIIPDVYAGRPVVVSGRYRGHGMDTVKVNAHVAGREVSTPVKVSLPKEESREAVAYLWARRRIHELANQDFEKRNNQIKDQITALGLQFHLVTDYTSFVAVDEQRVVNKLGLTRTIVQPVPLPEGVQHQGVFGSQPSQPQVSSRRSGGGGINLNFGGGGGAVDPLTIGTLLMLLPTAHALRRRRRKGKGEPESDA